MVKPLSDREKKKIAKKANAQSKASSQKTTSGSSSSSGIYNNSARKSARQTEAGRTVTTRSGGSTSRGGGFEPDSVARSGKTRSQLLSELDRKYGQDFSKKDIHDGNRDFLDRIDNLTTKTRFNRQVRNNEKEAQYNHNLMALQRRNDLDDLAAAGRKKFANGAFDLTDRTGKTVEELGVRPETRDDVFNQNAYDFMTPEQRSIYEAFIGLGDRKSANRYLASIEEGLQQQAADKLLQTIQPGNIENVQDFADVTRLGVRSGIGRFETGVQQLVNPNAVSKNYTEMAFEEARKDMSGATGVVADLANTVGFMLLPAGGSMVLGLAGGAGLAGSAGVKALSASLFGAASGGSTYNDMLQENPGADKFDAKVYSVINGALEGSLQYALGGIGKLGVGGLSKVTGKTISGAVAKKLSNVAKASANTPAVKGLIKALVGGGKWAAGASDEALEEWLQAVLDPVMRNYVLGENNEVKLFGEDQLYAAFLGALGATVMNAPSNVSSFANAEQILNETVAKQEAKAAARANKNQPANAEAQAIPEATKEQIEAHMDNPDVKDLVIQINRLEAGIATGKSRHNDSPTGRKAQLVKAKKDLAALIAKLEQQQAPEQAAPADIPEMPKAPVENEEAIETLMRELGNVQDIDEAQPSGEQQLGEQARERALQLQEELGLTEEAPVEDEALPAEDEALPVEDEELPDEELPGEELPAGEEEEYEGYTLEETVDRFRADIAEARRNRKVMRGEGYDYNQYIKMLEINFRHDAAELGMSEAEIEAIINSEGSTTRTVNRKEKVAPNPTETASEAVTDEDIDELLNEEPAPVENPVESKQATDGMDNIRDIADAVVNEEMDVNEGYDEIRDLLNQMDQEREAAGEAVGEATEPEVTVTEGRIEVRFPKWPGRKTTDELRKAGFKWDKEAGIWFGGENNTNKALVERLTGVKLTEDEFTPEVRRIPKEELNNGGRQAENREALLRQAVDGSNSSLDTEGVPGLQEGEAERDYGERNSRYDADRRTEVIKNMYNIGAWDIERVSGEIIGEDDDIYIIGEEALTDLRAKDDGTPYWGVVREATEQFDAEAINIPPDSPNRPQLKFYAQENPNADENALGVYDPNTNTIWINVSIGGQSGGVTTRHEYFHFMLTDEGFFDYALNNLHAAGLNDEQIRSIISDYIVSRWKGRYGDINNPDSYRRYLSEFMCELYCRNNHAGSQVSNILSAKYGGNVPSIESLQHSVIRSAITYQFDYNNMGIASGENISYEATNLRPATEESTVPSSTFTPNNSGEVPVENMIPGVKEIWQDLPDSAKNYMIKHLTDINGEAWKNIVKKGGVDAVSGTLLRAKNWTSPQLEMAVEVGKYFADNGETQRAADIFAKVASQQTDFGRAIKYLQTLQMYMPKSAAAITHSIASDLGVDLTDEERANIDLCDRIIEQGFISDSVLNKATGDFKEWLNDAREYMDRGQLDASTAAYAAAMTLVTAKKPATARQKFRSLQRISLLSNPKTHFRNILGNVAEQAGAAMSRPGADAVDRFLSKFTGQRTFGSGGGQAFAKAVADSIEKAVMDNALGINTVGNKFDEDTTNRKGLEQLARQNAWNEATTQGVKKNIAKVANDIDHLIGLGLSIGDAPFLIGTYESALAQIMNANGVEEATEEMMDTAWDVAFRRTFRDDNAITKSLSSIRNSLPFIGETIAPYVQTPVNVVLTAIQYSPIGFAEAFTKAFIDVGSSKSLRTQLKNDESTMRVQRQIAELVGRGALGTACMLVGALLRSAGKITGDDDDIDSQKEKNWNRAVGRTGSSIKVGDTYIDPSSLQSLSTPIMAGAAAYESKEEGDDVDWGGVLGAAVKASMKMGNTMLEMPVLQGVADLFSGNYDNGELLSGALSLAGNAATQVVPFGSLLKQGAKAVDPYSRVQSEINAGPGERVLKSTVNNLKTMLPGTRKTLSQRYDVLGNPIKNDASDNTVERLYNSFINPFNTSKENTNEVTDEIDRLYEALQDTDVLPTAAGNSISYNGEKYKFTSAEKQEYQRIEGESNSEILSSLVNSEAYDGLTDEEKAKILSSVYDYSSNKAKADYLKKQGVEYEPDAKWMASIDSIVETGVDIGSAMVYRYKVGNIENKDDQVHYIDSLPLSASQKKVIDESFVQKFSSYYIDEERDYTSPDTLALSMTSDSAREKYNNRFSGSWRGVSGNTYSGMSGEEFGLFYDAYSGGGSTAAEKVQSIKQMLMEEFGFDEQSAYTMAYDFRKYFAAKYD